MGDEALGIFTPAGIRRSRQPQKEVCRAFRAEFKYARVLRRATTSRRGSRGRVNAIGGTWRQNLLMKTLNHKAETVAGGSFDETGNVSQSLYTQVERKEGRLVNHVIHTCISVPF